jgi:hypothetical protein
MVKRKYGLFEKQDGKWVRLFPELAYTKEVAIRVFQTQLIDGFFVGKVRELRVLPKEVQHG